MKYRQLEQELELNCFEMWREQWFWMPHNYSLLYCTADTAPEASLSPYMGGIYDLEILFLGHQHE